MTLHNMVYIEKDQLTNTKGFNMDMSWLGANTMNTEVMVVLIVAVSVVMGVVGIVCWSAVIKKKPGKRAGLFNRLGKESQLPEVIKARKKREAECCDCDCNCHK